MNDSRSRERSNNTPEDIILEPVKLHESVWAWPDASPGQRVSAFVLDVLILSAALGVGDVLVARLTGDVLPSSLNGLAGVFYFIFMHSRSGQTLGKRFVGIRVVPLEQGEVSVPLLRVVLRETVGRLLSTVLFLYGYIRIALRADRMGLHDTLARTRVATIGEARAVNIKFKHVLAGVMVIVSCLAAGSYFVTQYTSYPIRQFARKLELLGFRIEGVSGSMAKGFTVASIAQETDDASFELKGIKFQYSNQITDGEREFIVRDLSVQSAKVVIRRLPELAAQASADTEDQEKDENGPFGANVRSSQARKLPGLLNAVSIDINDVQIQIPGRPAYELKRLVVSDLKFRPSAQSLSFAQLWVDSDTILLDIKDLVAQGKTIALNKPAQIQLRPKFYPELLKGAVDLQIEGVLEGRKPVRVSVSAFNKKVQVHLQGDSAEFSVTEFTPLHYLHTDLPVWNIDFRLYGDVRKRRVDQMKGSVGLRNVRFALEAPLLAHERAPRKFTIAPRLAADWRGMLLGRDPGIILGTNDKLLARDALAELYFSKPRARLSAQEAEMVDRDMRFFVDTPDAGTGSPVLNRLAEGRGQTSQRLPTSAEQRRKGAPPGVPTTLPPFRKKSTR